MNALFSFGISFLIRLFADLPAPGLSPGCFRVSPARYSQYAIKKIKNAASKIAIIQYRILPEDFLHRERGLLPGSSKPLWLG